MIETNIHPRLRRVFAETPYWLQAANVPGMTVALLEGGKTRKVLCFGSTGLDGKTPITEATIFQAASLSKQVLLYAVLKTVEAGKIDVERPLSHYVDTPFETDDIDSARITARHVLTHTTGWRNWPPDGQLIPRTWPLGEQWNYSGQGFIYLQKALEAIWNEFAACYLQRLVFDPLGMRASGFLWRDEYGKTATPGWDQSCDAFDRWRPAEVNTASGLHTTATEYARLLEAYLGPDVRERHPDVYRRQIEIDARLGWSLGWGAADGVLWQWGHNDGFKSFAAVDPARELGIAVLTNGVRGQRINREWVNAWLETDLPAFFFKRVEL